MDEWVSWEDARHELNVSRDKMSKLVKDKAIESKDDPLDERRILIRKSSVVSIKAQSTTRPPRKTREPQS